MVLEVRVLATTVPFQIPPPPGSAVAVVGPLTRGIQLLPNSLAFFMLHFCMLAYCCDMS